jgi:conjugative transfer pilus assembly protein TraH
MEVRKVNMTKPGRRVVAAVLAVALVCNTAAWGSFADDWLAQTNSTPAGHFEGSKRGYYTGGGFSARWPQSNDHLLTIESPSIKSGCGGIDMFLGGFSFLNMEYLGQKLQRILAAAPAAAFDIALKTLAPQVSDTIKSLEALVEKLNNLQLDDCKAAKALVATAVDFSGTKNEAMTAAATSAKVDFLSSSGIDQDWKGSIDKLQTSIKSMPNNIMNLMSGTPTANPNPATSVKTAESAAVDGCPATLKQVFTSGSVLANLATQKGIPQEYVDSMRGFIGDTYIAGPDVTGTTYKAVYIGPCDKSDFESFVNGTAEIRPYGGGCVEDSSVNANLVSYAGSKMHSIVEKMKMRQIPTPSETALLASLPIPVYPALRAAAISGQEEAIITKLADISARGLAYGMMLDLVVRIRQLQEFAKHMQSTQTSKTDCQLSLLDPIFEQLGQLDRTTMEKSRDAQASYHTAVAEMAGVEALVAALQRFDDITRAEISKRMGRGAAIRVSPGAS